MIIIIRRRTMIMIIILMINKRQDESSFTFVANVILTSLEKVHFGIKYFEFTIGKLI